MAASGGDEQPTRQMPAASHGVVPTLSELLALRQCLPGGHGPRRATHGVQTQAASRVRGRGMEYAESREYTPGDDARHIDWRLTARTGKPHTKLFQVERERLTLLVADTAPGLYFGTRVRFKSVQAARAGALLAWWAMREGDRLAALRGSRREAPRMPAGGMRGVLRVLEALVRWYAVPPADDAGLAWALEHALQVLRPGARVGVLADPASIAAVPTTHWAALARFETTVLLLTDPLETQPPRRPLTFLTPEGERLALALEADDVQQAWRRSFVQELMQAEQTVQRFGIRAIPLPANADSDSWLPRLERHGRR